MEFDTTKGPDMTERIIAATVSAIERDGFESISLRNLASCLGVTTGSLYRHFKGKDALLAEARLRVSRDLDERVEERLAREGVDVGDDPRGALLVLGHTLLTESERNPNLMDFLFFGTASPPAPHPAGDARDYPLLRLTRSIVGDLARSGGPYDERELFIVVWSFIQGYGTLIRNNAAAYDPGILAKTLDSLLEGGK